MNQNPNNHKNRDALYVELQELQSQQHGISPKLALHAELGRQIQAIKEQLGGNGINKFNKDTTGPPRIGGTYNDRDKRTKTRVI